MSGVINAKYILFSRPVNGNWLKTLSCYRRLWGKRANLKTNVSRKQSTPNFPKKEHFLPPDTHTHVRNSRFSENLACFVFLKHPFWYSFFCLLPTLFLFILKFTRWKIFALSNKIIGVSINTFVKITFVQMRIILLFQFNSFQVLHSYTLWKGQKTCFQGV